MSKIKHTPGPWYYSPQPIQYYGFYIQSESDAMFIGEAGGGTQSMAEIEANTKLMASAPELLEACKEALKELQAHNLHNSNTGFMLEDAIQKALGL